jgi:uncharacterized protein (DUF302 family)
MKVFWLVLTLTISGLCLAGDSNDSAAPVAVFKASGDFEDVVDNVKLAIEARGLLVSGVLHVSDMLNRTGPDLGYQQVFVQAEAVEFCSALISHKMTQVSPENMAICPFTISVFVRVEEPDQVYVAYRRQQLAGEAEAVTTEVHELLNGIVEESIE